MKAIYLEPFSGISGNMLLGALMDAGFSFEVLEKELTKLNLGEYELVNQRVNKMGIDAQYFNVILPDEHQHEHYFHEAGAAEHTHNHENCCGHHHDHEHADGHCCGHHHDHAEGHTHCHEHEHHHEHDNDDVYMGVHHEEHSLPHAHHHHEHRNLHDIMTIIDGSSLSQSIKDKARQVFTAIAVAEAKVHGKTVDEIHFHEVGAIDTIIDIVGCLIGLEYLGIEKIYAGKITTGYGFVNCAHGLMPVPAPATAELLQGLPQQQGRIERELTTPTGAALVRALATISIEQPAGFISKRIAYGAGSWELEVPNVLRIYVGEVDYEAGDADDAVVEAACNIDDMSGEVFAYAMEKLLQAGALDVWAEPIIMKKGRPAYKLVFLAEQNRVDDLLQIVFAETTTLGVRCHKVSRSVLERRFIEAELPQGTVNVKYAVMNGEIINIAPEYDSCRELAEASGRALKDIMTEAKAVSRAAIEEQLHE